MAMALVSTFAEGRRWCYHLRRCDYL